MALSGTFCICFYVFARQKTHDHCFWVLVPLPYMLIMPIRCQVTEPLPCPDLTYIYVFEPKRPGDVVVENVHRWQDCGE